MDDRTNPGQDPRRGVPAEIEATSLRAALESGPAPKEGPELAGFRLALLDFFDAARRDLPWRETDDPYRILVSEIMLQQTRVETVVPYYRKWIERFPDARTLADAELQEVLLHWQGLGYYRRARNLHAAVREVMETHGGEVPGDARTLASLPGVGPYTAGAVASIAFGEAVPAVDGNVRRVLARLLDQPSPSQRWLQAVAGRLVDPERPGDFNQALMELGATRCRPRAPDCARCPVSRWCGALRTGTVEARPGAKARRAIPHRHEAVAVVVDPEERLLLVRRPDDGLLGGMWGCPGRELPASPPPGEGEGDGERRVAEAAIGAARGYLPRGHEPATLVFEGCLPAVDHLFTHMKVTYLPVRLRLEGAGSGPNATPDVRWVVPGQLHLLPLPRAQERILAEAVDRA